MVSCLGFFSCKGFCGYLNCTDCLHSSLRILPKTTSFVFQLLSSEHIDLYPYLCPILSKKHNVMQNLFFKGPLNLSASRTFLYSNLKSKINHLLPLIRFVEQLGAIKICMARWITFMLNIILRLIYSFQPQIYHVITTEFNRSSPALHPSPSPVHKSCNLRAITVWNLKIKWFSLLFCTPYHRISE